MATAPSVTMTASMRTIVHRNFIDPCSSFLGKPLAVWYTTRAPQCERRDATWFELATNGIHVIVFYVFEMK